MPKYSGSVMRHFGLEWQWVTNEKRELDIFKEENTKSIVDAIELKSNKINRDFKSKPNTSNLLIRPKMTARSIKSTQTTRRPKDSNNLESTQQIETSSFNLTQKNKTLNSSNRKKYKSP